MKKIIISPFSNLTLSGTPSPKNYPIEYWKEVISLLDKEGHELWQIGRNGEQQLTNKMFKDLAFPDLKELASTMDTFIAVDNFFPHFCNHYGLKYGVVIFSKSDPTIFGYEHNTNLLKDKKYLRSDQFGMWHYVEYNKEAFVEPQIVIQALKSII